MTQPVRPMPKPALNLDGHWEGRILLTAEAMDTRALFTVSMSPVIPVIVVPGIMGSNLRAKRVPSREDRNEELDPGAAAWRPPNGVIEAFQQKDLWKNRSPATRQNVLDGKTLEVDDSGAIDIKGESASTGISQEFARRNWWGEVHADSYGGLLLALERNLNGIFSLAQAPGEARTLLPYWKQVMACEPKRWGMQEMARLTESELAHMARSQYPVYACGYNWLQSCAIAAGRLEERIDQIIEYWRRRRYPCKQVILVTHSMGGLVARACAKRVPQKIAGVIHGVMPALGAAACYRRLACGTEQTSPGNGPIDNTAAQIFALIAGITTEDTTAVMATSAGALQLLPNHRYPRPWLHIGIETHEAPGQSTTSWLMSLPSEEDSNPYHFYRNFQAWFRVINPEFADPALKYRRARGGITQAINDAITDAEEFHMSILDDYYHPNSYAFYGDDLQHRSFGQVRWIAQHYGRRSGFDVDAPKVRAAKYEHKTSQGGRTVSVPGGTLHFEVMDQDVRGDGTVPGVSGSGPHGKVRQLFATGGYSHQESYKDSAMLMLTHYLIAKIVQEAP